MNTKYINNDFDNKINNSSQNTQPVNALDKLCDTLKIIPFLDVNE